MMGMKRRGMGRRQVLNLNDKQDSPRRTWQTKYQQICAEHSSQNGNHSDGISSSSKSPIKNNPLSGLLGQYHSDSDTEDEGKKDSDQLNSKVSDFLKEIQTITPAEYSVASPSSHVPQVPHVVQKEGPEIADHAPVTPWQECYDENSGYVYYWNMETNEVTWDMPPGYQAYVESQEKLWMHEQHNMGMLPAQVMPQVQSVPAVVEPRAVPRVEEDTKTNAGKKSKSKNKDMDSDDERIEMITSYGPASDESDEEDEEEDVPPPVKKRKGLSEKSKPLLKTGGSSTVPTKRQELPVMGPDMEIGPQPEPIDPTLLEPEPKNLTEPVETSELHDSEEQAEGMEYEESPLLSADVPDLGAPGDENVAMEQEWSPGNSSSSKPKVPPVRSHDVAEESDIKDRQYPVPDSSEDKNKGETESAGKVHLADSVSSVVNKRVTALKAEEQEQCEEVAGSGTSTPVATTTEGESDDVESGETDEGVILSRLRSQARILKELGGEIPDEIQHLIEPAATSVASPLVAEDVIAQIEKELPPDYKVTDDKEKEISSVNKRKNRSSEVSSVENSPKTSSFALIAGYGDDSDPEDEKKLHKLSVTSKSPENVKVQTNCLFPSTEQSEKVNTILGPVVDSKCSALVKETNVASGSGSAETSDPTNSSQTIQAHGGLFPAAANIENTQVTEALEQVTSVFAGGAADAANLPDSTTNNKTFKRKKRLDLDGVFPAVTLKPSITQSTEIKGEKSKPVQSSAVPSVASSTVTYTKWTSYNSDPTSGERRGFGFQINNEDVPGYFASDISFTEPNNSTKSHKVATLEKKGIINFVKAETLNPVPEEESQDVKGNPIETEPKPAVDIEIKVENAESKEEYDAHQQIEEMAQLITEKVNFLGEGKEPVSPVQVMAIQIETLVSAWQVGALSRSYWSRWLTDTAAELARLEQAAAPDGWACEWDRSYKRYYYRNVSSGETQWEYPEEDAMELCTTPPPPPPPPIIMEEESPRTPPTPPPPQISTKPAPTHKKKKKKKADGEVTSSSDGSKVTTAEQVPIPYAAANSSSTVLPPLPPLPPPPVVPPPPPPPPPPSDLPPLPPSTPPLPPSTPPLPDSPPPPPIHRHDSEHGEPLPPGVDPPELPYIVARPPISVSNNFPNLANIAPPPPPPNDDIYPPPSPPDSTDIDMQQVLPDESMAMGPLGHPLQGQYVMGAAYQQGSVVSSSIPTMTMGPATAIEYGAVPYVTAMPMPMPMPATSIHVIAKPPAKKTKASLHAELDSFYSDLASLESTGTIPPPMVEPVVEQAAPADVGHAPSSQDNTMLPGASVSNNQNTVAESEPLKPTESVTTENRKKKKPKLAPGLALKKKGVSSLVAKWQQVQQEVRRDYKNLDDDDGVSSTHK